MESNPIKADQIHTAMAFRDALIRVIAALVPDKSDRDDIVQETLLRLMESDLEFVRNVEAWMTTVARRLALDRLRSRARNSRAPVEESLREDRTLEERDLRQLSSCLHAHLGRLSPQDRSLLEAIDSSAQSRAQLARDRGISLKGLNSRVRRARENLRGLFAACCRTEFNDAGEPVGLIPKQGGDCKC